MNKIILAVVVVVVGVVGYFAFVNKSPQVAQQTTTPTPTKTAQATKTPTPTPTATLDPTANWKTFTNTEFGYSFKYPSTYSAEEYATNVKVYESANPNNTVDFYGQKTNATLSSIIKDKTDGKVLSEATPTIINGLSAYEGVNQGMVSSYAVFVKNNSNLIIIGFTPTDNGSLQKEKTALTNIQKQILSTFKFTQ